MTDELLKKWKLIACDWQDVNSDLEAENERLRKELQYPNGVLVLKPVEYKSLKVGDIVLWNNKGNNWDVAVIQKRDDTVSGDTDTTGSVFYKLPAPGAK